MRCFRAIVVVIAVLTASLPWNASTQTMPPSQREQLHAQLKAMPPREQVTILNDLASRYYRSGDFTKGLEYANSLLAIAKDNYRESDKVYIEALHNIASLLTQVGHYAQAGAVREKAYALAEKHLSKNDLLRLAVMNGLATHYSLMRRYKDAEPIFDDILADCTKYLGPDDEYTLGAKTNIAGLYQDTSRAELTVKLLKPVINYYRERGRKTEPNAITSSTLLASGYLKIGQPDKAVKLLREFEAVSRTKYGATHQSTLAVSNMLAYSLQRAGDFEAAYPIYDRVAKDAASRFGADHPNTLTTELSVVSVLLRKGDNDGAGQRLARLAPLFLRWTTAELMDTGDAASRQQLVARQSTYPDVALSVAVQTGTEVAIRLAVDVVLQWKQLQGAQEAVLSQFIARTTDPAVLELAKRLALLRNQVAIAFHLGHQAASRLLGEAEQVEFQLAGASREFAEIQRQRRVGINEVNSVLESQTGLLEFRVYRPIDLRSGKPGERRLLGVLLTKDDKPIVRDLGPHSTIEQKVSIATNFEKSDARKEALRELAAIAVTPFEDSLRRLKRVYVAPDGALNLLPLEMLPFGTKENWIEAQDLRFVSTGRALVTTRNHKLDGVMVAIGAVEFDANLSSPQPGEATDEINLSRTAGGAARLKDMKPFKALPETGKEVADVTDIWKRATAQPVLVLSKAGTREQTIKSLDAAPAVLHFATHGFFLAAPQASSGPMLLSGLALAGANLTLKGAPSADGEDGILWALEAMSLRLNGTGLVAMSACDTAQGVVDAYEGIYGLSRGFQIAGAENVLVTLWALNDMRARAFMVEFYRRWLDTGVLSDPADALRATKLEWIKSPNPAKDDPQIWAPYVLIQRGT